MSKLSKDSIAPETIEDVKEKGYLPEESGAAKNQKQRRKKS